MQCQNKKLKYNVEIENKQKSPNTLVFFSLMYDMYTISYNVHTMLMEERSLSLFYFIYYFYYIYCLYIYILLYINYILYIHVLSGT